MKKVEFSVFDGQTNLKRCIELHSATGDNKVIATAISQVFRFNDKLREFGCSHIKANSNVSVVIAVNGQTILDTYELSKDFSEYGFVMKFGKAAKSKRKFTSNLFELISFAASDVKGISKEELIESLVD